jgi:hypothetical protein
MTFMTDKIPPRNPRSTWRFTLMYVIGLVVTLAILITIVYLKNRQKQQIAPLQVPPTSGYLSTPPLTETATLLQPTDTPAPEPTVTTTVIFSGDLQPGVSIGDLHIHTECSDGRNYYEEYVQRALALGYTFIATADHHWCPDLIETCRNETRLLCIPGVELSGVNHIVALNLQTTMYDNMPIVEQVRQIHAQGGLAIAAHPFLRGYVYSADDLLNSNFDAIECNVDGSGDPGFDISSLTCVWNSDAHYVTQLGAPYTYTVCDVLIRNFDELKAAILGGYCHPGME